MSCASPKGRLSLSRAPSAPGVLTKERVRKCATKKGLGTSDGPVYADISMGERQTMIGRPTFELTQVPPSFGLAPVRHEFSERRRCGFAVP